MAGKKGHALRAVAYTKEFLKDHHRMDRAGRYDMTLVNHVGGLLVAHTSQAVLSSEWKDHGLTSTDEWDDGDRDIHLGGDFILIYRIDPHPNAKGVEVVIFKRLGTHSDLFG